MTSLFAPFDLNNYSSCFIFLFMGMLLLFISTYKVNLVNCLINSCFSGLSSFFLTLKPKYFNKGSNLMFGFLIFLILITNFLSVFSFNFPLTSQISFVLFLGLSFWISFVFYSVINNFKSFLSHMIPEGTPLPLTLLLFLIELVSNIIRPFTLTVRLVANILAGHLLMSLLSSLVFIFLLSFPLYLVLNLVELFVALIQSYIFTTMIVLYFSEV